MQNLSDAKFEQKLSCGLENDMKNLSNFYQSTWKISNLELWWNHSYKKQKYSLKTQAELAVYAPMLRNKLY